MNGRQIDAVNNALEEKDAEIEQLRGSKAALQVEIERLRELNDKYAIQGKWHHVRGGEPAAKDDDYVVLAVGDYERLRALGDKLWTEHLIEREDLKAEVKQLKAEADKSWLKREELKAEINKLKTENEARRVQLEATKREAEKMVYESGFKLGEAHKEIARLKLSRDHVKRAIEELLERYGQIAAKTGLE